MGLTALFMVDLISRLRGGFRGNAARIAMRPIVGRLASTHPKHLAKNGDSGRGIANTSPWYNVFLTVDLTPDLEEIVISAARDAGYQLHVDQQLINGMLGLPGPGGNNATFRGEFNPTSSYLIAESDGRTLRAGITCDGEVRVFAYGPSVTWNQRCTPPTGKAIVSLGLSLPDIR